MLFAKNVSQRRLKVKKLRNSASPRPSASVWNTVAQGPTGRPQKLGISVDQLLKPKDRPEAQKTLDDTPFKELYALKEEAVRHQAHTGGAVKTLLEDKAVLRAHSQDLKGQG